MTIYLVLAWIDYSDYVNNVQGIYVNKTDAETFLKILQEDGEYDGYRIDEAFLETKEEI